MGILWICHITYIILEPNVTYVTLQTIRFIMLSISIMVVICILIFYTNSPRNLILNRSEKKGIIVLENLIKKQGLNMRDKEYNEFSMHIKSITNSKKENQDGTLVNDHHKETTNSNI